MPDLILRDASTPFDPADPVQLAEFQGFACDVPTTGGLIAAVQSPPGVPDANSVRADRMFSEAFKVQLLPLSGSDDLLTPDPAVPTSLHERQGLHDQELSVPGMVANDGLVTMWSFEDTLNDRTGWPAPTIRVREGEIVHSLMNNRTGPHTMHHHGIEPTAMNDGVGHLTFEVEGGDYAYQWQAAEAGTYFYHCHVNTTLHFEMGMYGALIVDPPQGAGFTFVGNDLTPYDVETLWVADDIDTRWHGLDNNPGPNNRMPVMHVADGLQGCDADGLSGFVPADDPDNPHLNDFNPNVFAVSGVAGTFGEDFAVLAGAGAQLIRGQSLLARCINASYCTQRWEFPAALSGLVIAADGRTFGREPFGRYSSPFSLASVGQHILLTTAQRQDILIDTNLAPIGTHYVEIHFHHWITDERLRSVRMPIVVTA